jgi:hypothetical protein
MQNGIVQWMQSIPRTPTANCFLRFREFASYRGSLVAGHTLAETTGIQRIWQLSIDTFGLTVLQ